MKLESNPKSTELPQLHLGLPICIDHMMNWRSDRDDHDLDDDDDDDLDDDDDDDNDNDDVGESALSP